MIGDEKHNINTGNLTDCADIMISKNAEYELINTAVDAVDSMDFSDDVSYGLITTAIDAGN